MTVVLQVRLCFVLLVFFVLLFFGGISSGKASRFQHPGWTLAAEKTSLLRDWDTTARGKSAHLPSITTIMKSSIFYSWLLLDGTPEVWFSSLTFRGLSLSVGFKTPLNSITASLKMGTEANFHKCCDGNRSRNQTDWFVFATVVKEERSLNKQWKREP